MKTFLSLDFELAAHPGKVALKLSDVFKRQSHGQLDVSAYRRVREQLSNSLSVSSAMRTSIARRMYGSRCCIPLPLCLSGNARVCRLDG